MAKSIHKICIFGVGLIGGSFACAYKKAFPEVEVIGAGRNAKKLQQAQELGVIDSFSIDLAEALDGVEVLVIGVPVGSIESVFEQVRPHLKDTVIITDVGSTKSSVVNSATKILAEKITNFVPGHPIAGTEKSGAEAAFAELFNNRRVILTPSEDTNSEAIGCVTNMWQACGAEVVEMSVEHHDEVLAATSHLPHMLAFSLVDTLSRMNDKKEIFKYAAGGFRDFTRIASSSPEMWQDICLANADALVDVINLFQSDLTRLTKAIETGDKETILNIFSRAKTSRDKFCNE